MADKKFNPLSFGYTEAQWKALTPRERTNIGKKAYRLRNSERLRLKAAKYNAENRERVNAARRQYHKDHAEAERARDKAYRAAGRRNKPKTDEQKAKSAAHNRRYYHADIETARAKNREKYHRYAEKILAQQKVRLHKKKSVAVMRLKPDEIWHRLERAINRALPQHIRDDVIGTMALAVLEGRLLVEKIESAARAFVTAYNRDNRVYEDLSLDAPIPGMDGMTYMDRLAAEEA